MSSFNFNRAEAAYYTPEESPLWDEFVDYCHDSDLDPAEEDFEEWREERSEPDPDFERQYELENYDD